MFHFGNTDLKCLGSIQTENGECCLSLWKELWCCVMQYVKLWSDRDFFPHDLAAGEWDRGYVFCLWEIKVLELPGQKIFPCKIMRWQIILRKGCWGLCSHNSIYARVFPCTFNSNWQKWYHDLAFSWLLVNINADLHLLPILRWHKYLLYFQSLILIFFNSVIVIDFIKMKNVFKIQAILKSIKKQITPIWITQ